MKRKNIILGAMALSAIVISAAGIAINRNLLSPSSADPIQRTITFQNSQDVVSSGGSSFYLSGAELSAAQTLHFNSTGDKLGTVDQFGAFQVNTNSIAKFASVSKATITYSTFSPETSKFRLIVGDANTGDFSSNIKHTFTFDCTNNDKVTKYFYFYSGYNTDLIFQFKSDFYGIITIWDFTITYTC